MAGPMSDSAFYEALTPSQSGASVSQQTFSSDVAPPTQFLQQQASSMLSTNIITCRLCQEIFLDPMIFPCGHTFCLACGEKWRKRQRICPQAGCDKPLGEAVPNLLVKEAAISHHARKSIEANQQQVLALQLAAVLQQQLLVSAPGIANHPPPMSPCEANGLYDDDIEPRGQQWVGAREVGGRKSRRNFQTSKSRDSERTSTSLEQTWTNERQESMPSIKESPAHESLSPCPKESKQEEATELLTTPTRTRYIPRKAFVRGTRGRRTEVLQMPSQSVSINRRSLMARLSGRPKQRAPGKSTEDFVQGKRVNQLQCDGVWMGDEQQNESQASSDLSSHPFNKLMQAKKEKSLWLKTKNIFSSNKAKK